MESKHVVKKKNIIIWICLLLGLCVSFIYQQKEEHRIEIADCKEQMLKDSNSKTQGEWKKYLLDKEDDVQAGNSEFQEYTSEVYIQALEEALDDLEKIENYSDYIQQIEKASQSLQSISIFSEQDTFSKENLEKTSQDYISQKEVRLESVNTDVYRNFFSFDLVHVVLFVACIFLIGSIMDENNEGLKRMLFSTKNGRLRRCLSKHAMLFLGCSMLCILFYGTIFGVCFAMYHGNIMEDIGKPIQSIAEFYAIPYNISIGCFGFIYLVVRIVIMFSLSMIIWGMLVIVENVTLTVSILGIIGACEYLLWLYIPINSNWNMLHYCNVFEWMLGNRIFSEYRNSNVAGHAIHKNDISFAIMVFLILIICSVMCVIARKRYPDETGLLGCAKWNTLRKWTENSIPKVLEKLSLFCMEVYKLLIMQKGIFVFLILIGFLYWQADLTEVNKTEKQMLYEEFISKHQGEVDADAKNEIEKCENQLKVIDAECESMEKQYEEGSISTEQWISEQVKMQKYDSKREFLQQIKKQTKQLEKLEQERGIKGWYVNQYSYTYLLGENKDSILYNIVFFVAIVLLSSSVFSEAKQEGMEKLLKVSVKGRGTVFRKKIKLVLIVVAFLFGISSIMELSIVKKVYGLDGIMAPVQSITSLEFIPIHCSIFLFVCFLYVVKCCIMFATDRKSVV